MSDLGDFLVAAFDRRVQAIERYDFTGSGQEVIREVTRVWEAEVAKTYNKRESMGLGSSHQLRKCLRGKQERRRAGNHIYFWMEPIYHNYHSTKWGTYVTVDYGQFIKEGIRPSMSGRYDSCVDRKLEIHEGGLHPGVPKSKFWTPMIARIRSQAIRFIRARYTGKFRKDVRTPKSTGRKHFKVSVRVGWGGLV